MDDLEEFMNEVPPKFKLRSFKKEITTLLFKGYSYSQILLFLEKKKDVKASVSTLKRQLVFWKKNGELMEQTSGEVKTKTSPREERKSGNSSEKSIDDFKKSVNRK